MTFSVVAFDPVARKWGVGVASRYLSVGSVVPWAKAGVGCVATQSYANYSYGPKGLKLLKGYAAREAGEKLIREDRMREKRQLGIVDSKGNSYSFTGRECHPFAGGIAEENFAVQGNLLTGEEVINAMAAEMRKKGRLEDRIMRALFAGDSKGGDRRGRQSAAILIVSEDQAFEEGTDVFMELRVEDHREPLNELNRLAGLWKATFLDREKVDVAAHQEEIKLRLEKLGFPNLESWLIENDLENSLEDGKLGSIAMQILLGDVNPTLPD